MISRDGDVMPRRSLRAACRAGLVLGLLAGALSASGSARADDATDRARVHFEVGIRRYDKKDYEGALREFQAAYAEKRAPTILSNVALCLRALGRNAEAIDALEQMLHDGGNALKPRVRAAAQRTIDELSPRVATVRVRTTLRDPPGTPPVRVLVTVDDRVLSTERLAGPVRVDPGDRTFTAHAPGHADASLQVRLTAGTHDTLVGLDLAPGTLNGKLQVTGVAPTANVLVDGVPIATGGWQGEVAPGPHTIEVRSDGAEPWSRDVVVRTGETTVVSPEGAEGVPPVPPEVPSPKRPGEKKPSLFYLTLGVVVHGGSRTLAPGPFAERAPTSRGFVGGGAFAKVGHHFGPIVALELWAEIGASKPKPYATNGGSRADYGVTHIEIGPALRLQTKGSVVRAYGAGGLGLEVTSVNGTVHDFAFNSYHLKGAGVNGCALFEGGVSFSLGPRFFIDLGPFFTVYGTGGAKEESTKARFFEDSPAVRGGVRALLGIDL